MFLIDKVFGTKNDRYLKSIKPLVAKVNALEEKMVEQSNDALKELTHQYKKRVSEGESLDSLLPEAFAIVREAAKRALGLRAFDVQIMGAIILHQGKIAEMKTGEGKTLVATLTAYLNALTGKGVHIVTVNDYLAKRDAEWMAQVFEQLGLTCKYVVNDMAPENRKAAYEADITYATNNELGFDYLRDNMAFDASQLSQRGQNFAIVDEVDSILIDEARTPLIISGPVEDQSDLYTTMKNMMPNFTKDDFEKDEKLRTVTLTDVGTDKAEALLRKAGMMKEDESLYDIHHVQLVHHINNALRAKHLFEKDVHYMIKDGEVMLIDEFTGRMTPGRRLSDGLHQAIEAKEGVDIKTENQALASTTFQNYFRLYNKLAGMTGTALTEAEEFDTIYNLEVIEVPTNVDVVRHDEADIIYRGHNGKQKAIVEDIRTCHKKGQPTLVGTVSIEKSEEFSKLLKKAKIPHKVLNARHHDKEADIVAQAGRLGAVTIATNMAGRGTDIKLGGNLDLLLESAKNKKDEDRIRKEHAAEHEAVMEAGGLRVISTERHESRRIDNQLRGRAGRQGDVGSSVFYLSLEDDLMRIFARNLEGLMQRLNMPEDEAIQHPWVSKSIQTAQKKIEGMHFDARKSVLRFDDILNEQRKVIYTQRREILTSENVADTLIDFREEMLENAINMCFPQDTTEENWNISGFHEEMQRLFMLDLPIQKWVDDGLNGDDVFDKTLEYVQKAWKEKEKRFGEQLLRSLEKQILLQVIDRLWRSHLQQLDYLRQGIFMRGYAQKDPVNEYARESFMLFEELLNQIKSEVVLITSRVEVKEEDLAHIREAQEVARNKLRALEPGNPYEGQRITRNAPCPCGSGKKYKHCHGKIVEKKRA